MIVLEWAEAGDLGQLIKERGDRGGGAAGQGFTVEQVWRMFQQVSSASASSSSSSTSSSSSSSSSGIAGLARLRYTGAYLGQEGTQPSPWGMCVWLQEGGLTELLWLGHS